MLKKILIGVGILAVLAVIVLGVVANKVVGRFEEVLKEKDPEFRQYITMTAGEQNAYVEKNLDNFLQLLSENTKADDEQTKKLFENMKTDPEVRAAGIELGRSIIASYILKSESLSKNLPEDAKEKFQQEESQFDARLDKYNESMKKYEPEKK